jgi:hypothetical protein
VSADNTARYVAPLRIRRQMPDGTFKSTDEMTDEERAEIEAENAARKAESERWRAKQEEDARTAVAREIATLRAEAEAKKAESDRLTALLAAFPDLRRYEGRWKKVAYWSPTVNEKVTDFDYRANCGCCSDSPIEVWMYVETPHGRVYSDPPMFFVGHRNAEMGGDDPEAGWQEKLRAARLPEAIVERVGHLFRARATEDDEAPDGSD